MLLFSPETGRGPCPDTNGKVLLFGSGLLGHGVVRALLANGWAQPKYYSFDWANAERQLLQLSELKSQFSACDLVWAAGRAGFGAEAAELVVEHEAFLRVLHSCRDACGSELRVHLISSAGGLYEGQRHVDRHSPVAPLRPYGEAKLRMENVLEEVMQGRDFQIYRPSSVFGHVHDSRRNLVSALIIGTLAGRPAQIFGSPSTLRDYVFSEDVGRFISSQLSRKIPLRGKRLILASGKPSTVDEVVGTVSRLMRRPIMLHYDLSPSNALHNSYRPRLQPDGFYVTPQEQAIARTIRAIASERP